VIFTDEALLAPPPPPLPPHPARDMLNRQTETNPTLPDVMDLIDTPIFLIERPLMYRSLSPGNACRVE
jgi:hypothetical protein